MTRRLLRLPDSERRNCAAFVITFALTIIAWACAHDIYLIGVDPRHFTEYHRPLLPIENLQLLAIQYAVVATFGPGMVFGALAFAASRLGTRTPRTLKSAWGLFIPFVVLIEITALLIGEIADLAYANGEALPFPASLYPDTTAGIAYTQSVNLTTYPAAAVFGCVYLLALWLLRKPNRNQTG